MALNALSTEALRLIEHKRKALEAVVRIARSIERFEQSLSAVLYLRGSAMQIPKTVLKTYKSLETQFEGRPNNELEQAIKGLENMLQHDLAQIMEISQNEQGWLLTSSRFQDEDPAADEVEEISHLLDNFRRRAQTTVYLRLVLRDRGIKTQPLSFSVSDDDIQIHINQLMAEEAICRNKIIEDIQAICNDMSTMITTHELPEYVSQDITENRDVLLENLSMLKAGKKIEDIPFSFEAIAVTSPRGESFDIEPDMPEQTAEQPQLRRRGVWSSLMIWLTTSWGTRWSDIRAGKTRAREE